MRSCQCGTMQSKHFHRDLIGLAGRPVSPSTELGRKVLREQQVILVGQSLNMALTNIFNGLLLAVIFWGETSVWRILAWYLPIVLFGTVQLRMWFRFRNKPAPENVSGRLLRSAEFSAVAMGAVWGSAIFILPQTHNLPNLLLLVMIQCGMSAGVASLLSTVPRMVVRFGLACTGLSIIGLLWHRDPYAIALIWPGTTYIFALGAASLVSYRHLVENMRSQVRAEAARNDLVDAINSTQDAFALLDGAGRVVMSNQSHRDWFPAGQDRVGEPSGEPVQTEGGRWVITNQRKTSNGGLVSVHTDVTALKQRERELIDARREAEEADASKSRFMAAMSHELRTPLNIIIGFSRLMSGESKIRLTPQQVTEYADHINVSGEQLLLLINDIIDYSRMGLENYDINCENVPVGEMVTSIIATAQKLLPDGHQANFSFDGLGGLESLHVSETALRRILLNLISNAVKFGGEQPRVVIRGGIASDGRPFLMVRDFGIGMTEADCEHAFDAFWQASSALSRTYSGTGLGLTLGRHLARLHGGDIKLKSRPGIGTTAVLVLPAACIVQSPGETGQQPSNEDLFEAEHENTQRVVGN